MRRNEGTEDTNRINNGPLFGVAGFPPNFFESELKKKRDNIFQWLADLNLDWIELQCTRGVKMKADQAYWYRQLADEHGIGISIHGPYFISLASGDHDVVKRSRERIMQCVDLASLLQTDRIIFHPGFFPGNTPDDRRLAVNRIVQELNGLKHDIPSGIHILPETAGKNSQIGSLGEIINICEKVEYARPCIDLAHIHAFEHGSLWTTTDISKVFEQIRDCLGDSYLDSIHVHMYPVDFNDHGEKKHKAFADSFEPIEQLSLFEEERTVNQYYPRAECFVEAITQLHINPVVVCEAYNTQEIGASLMKKLFFDGVDTL